MVETEALLKDIARKEFFNNHAEEWLDRCYKDPDTGRYDLHAKKIKEILSQFNIKPDDHILDAGCGSGILVPYILERLSSRGWLWELDYAENMMDQNRQLHRDVRIGFIHSDVCDIPLENETCDLVICFACFPHFPDKMGAVRSLVRVLKEDSLFVIAHLMSSRELNSHHKSEKPVALDKLPERTQLERIFKNNGLTIEYFRDQKGSFLIIGRKTGAKEV